MKVIVAIDQTESADQVLETVCAAYWTPDTQFKVLTVIQPLQWESVPCIEWNKEAAKFFEERRKFAEETVRRAKKQIQNACPHCKVKVEVRCGDPKEEITEAAVEWMADRMILGAHGNSPNRFFRGSVARSVSQYCACSVQLVRLKPVPVKEQVSSHKHGVAVTSH
ncbi:MAG TPA: universal stress protein [Drouetiella sp.]|jgi:nucleotide-binding universal stress UspA family protein